MGLSNMEPLPNPFYEASQEHFWRRENPVPEMMPLVEREMLQLSYALRSKPFWWSKFRDPEIAAKWRAEALAQAHRMKERHIDYVLQELDGYANLRDGESGVEVACYDGIWQSDSLVPAKLKERLLSGVAILENIPDPEKDWHPNSNNMVLDLVHPSLYPIVYGRTLAYPEGTAIREPSKLQHISPPVIPSGQETYHLSQKFQWLPTDFVVSEDGKSVKSVSYINNLHPDEHRDLHLTIEELIGAFLPLFVRVLTDIIPQNKIIPVRTTNRYSYSSNDEDSEPEYEDYDDDNEYDQAHEAWSARRLVSPPDVNPKGYVPGKFELRYTSYELAGKTIQVIVKLANIHLTPDKPTYGGGSWHVEGMSNEAIAASGIYYYDEENITESRLAFRTTARPPENYGQDDTHGCMETWGIGRLVFHLNFDYRKLSTLGVVITRQDRAIAFPNIYQHKVSPFELRDKSKPGHRKIVALFLVDPAVRRPSTTEVPPQQQKWITPAALANPTLKRLSVEVISHISALTDSSMTREEAESFRLELMNERKAFVIRHDEKFSEVTFDMCEH
ncbi:hypothetical protein RhiJN_05284 [Ceratobasidium sp. AG-Ba]|nr:hypothetical protein RhiJN_05284 [Ceratobasidium sp. AG-Ba]